MVVLRPDVRELDCGVLAKHYNKLSNTIVEESFYDKIKWMKRMLGIYLAGYDDMMAKNKKAINEWKTKNKGKKRNEKTKKPKEVKPLKMDKFGRPKVSTAEFVSWLDKEVERDGSKLWVLLGQKDKSKQSVTVKAALAIDMSDELMDYVGSKIYNGEEEVGKKTGATLATRCPGVDCGTVSSYVESLSLHGRDTQRRADTDALLQPDP